MFFRQEQGGVPVNIAFWGETRGSGTTSNLLAVACALTWGWENGGSISYKRNEAEQLVVEARGESGMYTLIDCGSREDVQTEALLEKADLVVVNVRQTKHMLEHYFLTYGSLPRRSFFLIGSYYEDCWHNWRNLEQNYRIPRGQVGVIPYNQEFCEARSRGRLEQFMQKGYAVTDRCTRRNPCNKKLREPLTMEWNRYFFDEVRKTATLLRKSLEE